MSSAPKVLSGVFLGYEQQEGGGWNGDLAALDWEQIDNVERFSDVHTKRFKAAEIDVVRVGTDLRFPLAEGILRQPGSDRHKAPRV